MSEYVPPPILAEPLLVAASPDEGQLITDIVFDIDATGRDFLQDEILHIAAVTMDGQKVYESYILPTYAIPEEISDLTGLEINNRDGEDCMFLYCMPVESLSLQEALEAFIVELKVHAKNESKINLMAHNGLSFDFLILCQALSSCNLLSDFTSVVISVTDTDKVFKSEMPRLKPNQRGLVELARIQGVLPEKPNSRNALDDAVLLAAVVSTLKNTDSTDSSMYAWSSIPPLVQYLNKRSELRETLRPLIEKGILTWNMATKAAGSGIAFSDLEEAYSHSQKHGLRKLLSGKDDDNKFRVTSHWPIINNIVEYFSSLLGNDHDNVQADVENDGPSTDDHKKADGASDLKQQAGTRQRSRNKTSHKNQHSNETVEPQDNAVLTHRAGQSGNNSRNKNSSQNQHPNESQDNSITPEHSDNPRNKSWKNSSRKTQHSNGAVEPEDRAVSREQSGSSRNKSRKTQQVNENGIGDRVLQLESELKEAKDRIQSLELDIRAKMTDLAQQQCANSIRIFGVEETQNENTEDEVLKILRDQMKIPCSNIDIDHCHRLGRYQSGTSRPIVVKLSSYRIKRQVLRSRSALKGTKFVLWEELADERLKLYHAVRAKVGVRNTWTSEGRILASNQDGKVCSIHTMSDISRL